MSLALLLSAIVWLAEAPAEDDWTCVASSDGRRWQCGRGANTPELRALPPPAPAEEQPEIRPLPIRPRTDPTPVEASQPTAAGPPTIFAPTTPAGSPAAAEPGPSSGPTIADGYTLYIASLNSVEDVESFAESFEVNTAQAGRATVMESGRQRYVLTYGWFDTPSAASAAADELPPALRALNPRVVSTDSFVEPPRPLRPPVGGDDQPGPAIVAEVTAEEPAGIEPTPEPSADTADESASEPLTPSAAESTATPPESGTDTPSSIPSVVVAAETEPRDDRPAAAPAPREPAARAPATPAVTPSSPNGSDGTAAADARAFARADGRYTIQLANLPTPADVPEFLERHGLSDEPVYALSQPDGRSLLVYGRFESVDAANSAMADLPDSLLAPWIRHAAPLVRE